MNFNDWVTEEEKARMEEVRDDAFDLGGIVDFPGEDPDVVRNWQLEKIAGSLAMIAYYLSVLAGKKEDE